MGWEQIMCNRNERIRKNKEEMKKIEDKTKAMLTKKDIDYFERFIKHNSPETIENPLLIEAYKEKFMDKFIESKIEEKLGEETKKEYEHLGSLVGNDEIKNARALKRHLG